MGGLLNDDQKAAIFADFARAMETFARPLTVYQEAQRTVVVSNPDFNPIEDWNQNNTDIQNTPVFSTISGRILWSKDQEWRYLTPGGLHPSQLKLKDATKASCRLKVDSTGYALLRTAKKVQIDGILMDPDSEPRQHGPFGTGFWTFSFVRSS